MERLPEFVGKIANGRLFEILIFEVEMYSEAVFVKNKFGEHPIASASAGSSSTGARLLLSIQEVSHAVNRGKTSLYEMMKNGDFPKAVKVGASTRWLASDVEQWISSLKNEEAL
ncbi:helix-turn-helix transcriptional regulator [Hydrogenophaga sp.]|uniref:helix-turn-helix transcriptional regulator n=1 Tax=Hydrogenophaga sp. TaxID=1904254 RepID=UPI0035AEABC3